MSENEGIQNKVINYSITDAAIAEMKEQYSGMEITCTKEYSAVKNAIAVVRTKRIEVEKMRKEFKSGALEYGRKVDTEATRVTALLLEVEEPLKETKQAIDTEKARKLEEARLAEQTRVDGIQGKITEMRNTVGDLNDLRKSDIEGRFSWLASVIICDKYAEFISQAETVRERAMDTLANRLNELMEREEEQETKD